MYINVPKFLKRSNSVCLSPVSTMIEKWKKNPKEFYNDSQISKNNKQIMAQQDAHSK